MTDPKDRRRPSCSVAKFGRMRRSVVLAPQEGALTIGMGALLDAGDPHPRSVATGIPAGTCTVSTVHVSSSRYSR